MHKRVFLIGMAVGLMTAPVSAATRYVNVANPTPQKPYKSWATAATSIQEAIEASSKRDKIIVTNGIYRTGGKVVHGTLFNRVAITKKVTVQSVNGPEFTIIDAIEDPTRPQSDAVRCVYIREKASLIGFTLVNGTTQSFGDPINEQSGGGAWCLSPTSVLSNCVVMSSGANNQGGGIYSGTLLNCQLIGNHALQGGGAANSRLRDCLILDNQVEILGGGVYRCDLATSELLNNYSGHDGGGAYDSELIQCTLSGNEADNDGGGVIHCILENCLLENNKATEDGGGARQSTLTDCILSGNMAGDNGGGAHRCTLTGCRLIRNQAVSEGGGAEDSQLHRCHLIENKAFEGGGVDDCVVTRSHLNSNEALQNGGGAYDSVLINCALANNSTALRGGGAYGGFLTNCTLTANVAGSGAGVYSSTMVNSIAYFNTTPQGSVKNYLGGNILYSCTTPLPSHGEGNIEEDPKLAGTSQLTADSPCRRAGNSEWTIGQDIHGDAWSNPPSMGCDEYLDGPLTGPIELDIQAGYTQVSIGFPVRFHGLIDGRITGFEWDFGDGTRVTETTITSHQWASPGEYRVMLQAFNDEFPNGVTATQAIQVVVPPVHYVSQDSAAPSAPFSHWGTAAQTINEAIDVASIPGSIILVSNGTYRTGGRVVQGMLTNRVVVDRPVTVQSLNGPAVTVIEGTQVAGTEFGNGDGAVRCVYLGEATVLDGFTITNGGTLDGWGTSEERQGGGIFCESTNALVLNCVIRGNAAGSYGSGGYQGHYRFCQFRENDGAHSWAGTVTWATLDRCIVSDNASGAYRCTLNSCLLTGNRGQGAAVRSTLNQCTITGNVLGIHDSEARNCIVTDNIDTLGLENNHTYSTLIHCCTNPLPPGGDGNINRDPVLTPDGHLTSASPCRGAGHPDFAVGLDIDGEFWGHPPSMGWDEYKEEAMTDTLAGAIHSLDGNHVATGFGAQFEATLEGRVSSYRWEMGDGTILSNATRIAHAWQQPGSYTVTLRAYNRTHPEGVTTNVIMEVTRTIMHVAANASNPVPPYDSWATATRTIQHAVQRAQVPGTLILVTNGVYRTGGATGQGGHFNRVEVRRPLILRSVNGPHATTILGYNSPQINGFGNIRIVSLADRAVLEGFTLLNGSCQDSGGGVWGKTYRALVTNCLIQSCSAKVAGGGAFGGTLRGCTLSNNRAPEGGGAVSSRLSYCHLDGNLATRGGGASKAVLEFSALVRNTAQNEGGGAYFSTLHRSVLSGNSASRGGGAYGGNLLHSELSGNSATYGGGANHSRLDFCRLIGNSAKYGGGASVGTLNHCQLIGNHATSYGGGAATETRQGGDKSGPITSPISLNHCLILGNSAERSGGCHGGSLRHCTVVGNVANQVGGLNGGSAVNSILYFNVATNGANYDYSGTYRRIQFSCTTPLPPEGDGNITNAPLFIDQQAGNYRLQANSPCIDMASNELTPEPIDTDLDGRPRVVNDIVDMGAYEFQSEDMGNYLHWLVQFGQPTDGSGDELDADGDQLSNFAEWRARTKPTDRRSVLRMHPPIRQGSDLILSWDSVAGRSYFVEGTPTPGRPDSYRRIEANIPGKPETTFFTNRNVMVTESYFFRVGID